MLWTADILDSPELEVLAYEHSPSAPPSAPSRATRIRRAAAVRGPAGGYVGEQRNIGWQIFIGIVTLGIYS